MTETPTEAFSRQNVGERMFAGLGVPPIRVELAWPVRTLNPNEKPHWARKAKAVKSARTAAFYATRAVTTIKPNWKGAALSVTFCPPDKRRRDEQNCIISAKALIDGIADALGVDDSQFRITYAMGEPIKGGSVRVEILPI
jgi:crossover junction endodeoxyribonuclease RusA